MLRCGRIRAWRRDARGVGGWRTPMHIRELRSAAARASAGLPSPRRRLAWRVEGGRRRRLAARPDTVVAAAWPRTSSRPVADGA